METLWPSLRPMHVAGSWHRPAMSGDARFRQAVHWAGQRRTPGAASLQVSAWPWGEEAHGVRPWGEECGAPRTLPGTEGREWEKAPHTWYPRSCTGSRDELCLFPLCFHWPQGSPVSTLTAKSVCWLSPVLTSPASQALGRALFAALPLTSGAALPPVRPHHSGGVWSYLVKPLASEATLIETFRVVKM